MNKSKLKIKMEELKQKKLYKITNRFETHYHYKYKDGLNVLDCIFDESPICGKGGLYFATEDQILNWFSWGVFIREVTLCEDSRVVKIDYCNTKYKTDKFILGPKRKLDYKIVSHLHSTMNETDQRTHQKLVDDFYHLLPGNAYIIKKSVIQRHPHYIFFLKETDPHKEDLQLFALQQKRGAFKYICNPSNRIMKEAVTLYPCLIQYIRKPSLELQRIAAKGSLLVNKIMKVDPSLQIELYKNHGPYICNYIRNLVDEIQQDLITMDKRFIVIIKNPSMRVLNDLCTDAVTIPYAEMFTGNTIKYVDATFQPKILPVFYKYFNCGIDFLEFCMMLKACRGYLSGSLLVQTLLLDQNKELGENYNKSDVDIFFNRVDNVNKFGYWLEEFGLLRKKITRMSGYCVMNTHVDCIHTYYHKDTGLKIQLILLTEGMDVVSYIMTYFDLSICMNVFDGELLYTKKPADVQLDKPEISQNVFNILELVYENLIHRFDKVKLYKFLVQGVDAYNRKVMERIKKYIDRGFVFDNSVKYYNTIKQIQKKLC